MEVYKQQSKYLLIILFLILSNKIFSQSIINDSYITQDTIVIKKPIIVIVKGYDGKFILSEESLKETENFQKGINNQKIFLYNDDGIGFISSIDRKKNNVSIGECGYIRREEKGNLIILKLPLDINKFYLGFVKLSFYNKRVISSNNKKAYLKDENNFKPILYPICKDSE